MASLTDDTPTIEHRSPASADGAPMTGDARTDEVTITTRRTYAEAQADVDRLSDEGFPVEGVRIIADDLRWVEQVTGRRTTLTAGLRGAGSGAMFGALLGAIFGSFSLVDPLYALWVTALYGLVIGAIIGGVIGAIGHAALRGRRDFDAVGSLTGSRYRVTVDPADADRARSVLGVTTADRPTAADVGTVTRTR